METRLYCSAATVGCHLIGMEVICASAQRRSRQEMREAAQSWEVRVRHRGAMRLATSRRYETGGKRRLCSRDNQSYPPRVCRRYPRTLTKSGQAYPNQSRVTCSRRRFPLIINLFYYFPTMIGTLPVIHTVGEAFRHAVPIVPLCHRSSGGGGCGGGWWVALVAFC